MASLLDPDVLKSTVLGANALEVIIIGPAVPLAASAVAQLGSHVGTGRAGILAAAYGAAAAIALLGDRVRTAPVLAICAAMCLHAWWHCLVAVSAHYVIQLVAAAERLGAAQI